MVLIHKKDIVSSVGIEKEKWGTGYSRSVYEMTKQK